MAAIIGSDVVEGFAGLAHAVKYCRAAQSEEKNGFAFTAAVEWQKAAELLAAFPRLADRCWRQWERIMHLPRHMAAPISETQPPAAAQFEAAYDRETEQYLARIAHELFMESAADDAAVEVLVIPPAQMIAAAA